MASDPNESSANAPVGSGAFDEIKARLDVIVEAVGAEDIPLEEALDLYEEAVSLGMKASELLEEGFDSRSAENSEAQSPDAAGAGDGSEEA